MPALTLSVSRPGWMSFLAGKGIPNWSGRRRFPVAITSNDGQLFISMAIDSIVTMQAFKTSYQGKKCYNTFALMRYGHGIDLFELDEDKMRAANSWYPKELPAWEGKQLSCGDFLVRAEAARHQRVVVVLDPRSWFGRPLHRLLPKRRHASGTASERSR